MHSYTPLIPHTQVAPTDTSSVSKHVTPVHALSWHTREGAGQVTGGQYITAMYHGVTVTPFRNSTQTKFRESIARSPTTHILPVVRWSESRGAIPREDLGGLLSGQCSEWPGLRRLYSIPSHSETGSHHVAQVSLSQTPSIFLAQSSYCWDYRHMLYSRAQLFNIKYEAMDIKEFPRESQWYLHFQRLTGFLTR